LLHESGETLESNTEIIFNKLNDAQAQGSGISYARRYGLQSFLCVGADDDDGNKASAVSNKPLATAENLAKAKLKGATITEVEKYYTLTEKQKNEY
jgi:hypothetical protein